MRNNEQWRRSAATDLAVDAAVAGSGVIHLFESWLRPYLDSGTLEPVLGRFTVPQSLAAAELSIEATCHIGTAHWRMRDPR